MFQKLNQLLLLSYSFFGLPWLFSSVFLATMTHPLPKSILFWTALLTAFLAARTVGMGLNRVIDVVIDAKNPRTAKRPLQLKLVSRQEVKLLIVCATLLFVSSCYVLSPLCFYLTPLALFLLFFYSYTKRFTPLCHFVLGAVHFFIPLFVFAAITEQVTVVPVLLGLSLWLFIASNDVIYAFQDISFDQEEGLYSIPAKFGIKKGKVVVQICHLLAFCFLGVLGVIEKFGAPYFLGFLFIISLYGYQHLFSTNFLASFEKKNYYGGLIILAGIFLQWLQLF